MTTEYKAGDYYKCQYTTECEQTIFSPHHCFEGLVATVEKADGTILFYDTFWGVSRRSEQSKVFTTADVGVKIELQFIANINDLVPGTLSDSYYYNSEDLVILHEQHSCSPSCKYPYRRKGAVRSAAVIEESIIRKIEHADRDMEMLQFKKDRLRNELRMLRDGKMEDIWI